MTHYCTNNETKKAEIASPVSPTKKLQAVVAACNHKAASGDDAAVVEPSAGNYCVQHKTISNHCTSENGSVSFVVVLCVEFIDFFSSVCVPVRVMFV